MKTTKLILFTIIISVFAGSVSAASAVQVWHCRVDDGHTFDEVMAVSKAWLDAAKTMEGGAELEVYIGTPVAGAGGDGAFTFVMVANDFATWGTFNNGYEDSVAAEADAAFAEVASCSDSSLEASYKVE